MTAQQELWDQTTDKIMSVKDAGAAGEDTDDSVTVQAANGRSSVAASGDAALPGQAASQDITINSAETLFPTLKATGGYFNVAANRWVVVLYVYKKTSGPGVALRVDGATGISGTGTADSSSWETLVGVLRTGTSAVTGDFLQHQASATTVIRIGGIAVVQFDTRQQAIDFANSLLFPA